MGTAATILASVSVVAIPCVLLSFKEVPFETHLSMSLRQRLQRFWKFCHQNFVSRVLFFIGLHLFLVGLYYQNVRDAVHHWSGVTPNDMLKIEIARMAAQVLSTVVWKYHQRNLSWRMQAFWDTTAYLMAYVVLTLFTVYGVIRNKRFFGIMIALGDIPRAWLIIYGVILATEIAEVSQEGVISALGISFHALAGLASYTLAAIFPTMFGVNVSMQEVTADTPGARADVTKAFFIVHALNPSYALIRLPPQQKLDAQQMRAFGGYNKNADVALVTTFVILLAFNLVANLVVGL